jgi:hypothetical protein
MVKRLLDEQGLEGTDRKLAELFRAAAPFEVNAFSRRRVLVNLERRQGTRGSVSRLWLRGAVVGALLITGSAAAAIGHRHAEPGSFLFGWFGSHTATAASPKALPKVAPASAAAPVASVASDPSEASSAEPEPAADIVMQSRSSKSGRTRPESSEDGKHIVEAIQALRTERDPSRAQALLNDYLKSHPHGVLSGDALALSIEAASAQHDPRAADYARRYLSAFPNGKYRDLANRALSGSN